MKSVQSAIFLELRKSVWLTLMGFIIDSLFNFVSNLVCTQNAITTGSIFLSLARKIKSLL